MIQQLKTTAYILLFIFIQISCSQKNNEKVKITATVKGAKNQKVEIITTNLLNLDDIQLSESTLDSSGNAVLEFDLAQPVFAFLKSGEKYALFYLIPGDDVQVSMNANVENKDIQYAGDGANVNGYLSDLNKINDKYEMLDGKHPFQLELKPFLVRLDSVRNEKARLLRNLVKNTKLSKETEALLAAKNQLSLIFLQQNFSIGHYGIESDNPEIPEPIKSAINNIPFDTTALKTNMYDYGIVLSTYMQGKIFSSVNNKLTDANTDSLAPLFPSLVDKEIRNGKYPVMIKEFLLAKNINYNINMEGITPQADIIYTKFKAESKNSNYLSALKKSYDKWLAIAPGKPAPDFTGITSDGKKISLSDLKGKVVYMDVWATWCGPCKEEFPDSKKVEKHFEGNDKVAFLFVSIDDNVPAWKKMLSTDKIPKGIHINQVQKKQPDAIWESYHIWGIPRYILINAEGRIVQTHAERPSSGKVAQEIEKLLNSVKLTQI